MSAREEREGWLYASPWIIGLIIFTLLPMIASLVISLTDWNLLTPPTWVGLGNYKQMLFGDPLVWSSLWITTKYALISVPLNLVVSLFLAMLLNSKVRGVSVWRAVYYLPTVVPGVAVALVWQWLFNTDFGAINAVLHSLFGIKGPNWLLDTRWIMPSFVFMSLWHVGAATVINLAGLQAIPESYYEAARLDGAGPWPLLRHITVPMLSPVLFFNLVMGMIAALQTFTQALVMTGGGPDNKSLFFMLYLYSNAFQWFKMGYASALAWLLFAYILILTLIVFRWSKAWVYYEGGVRS
jgi:multiple sugar transport system permease protein